MGGGRSDKMVSLADRGGRPDASAVQDTRARFAAQFRDKKGEGVTLCFFCDDAVGFYRDVTSRGIDASEPFVGNMMWVTEMTDPDGYELLFESPTNVVEGTKLSELAQTNLA